MIADVGPPRRARGNDQRRTPSPGMRAIAGPTWQKRDHRRAVFAEWTNRAITRMDELAARSWSRSRTATRSRLPPRSRAAAWRAKGAWRSASTRVLHFDIYLASGATAAVADQLHFLRPPPGRERGSRAGPANLNLSGQRRNRTGVSAEGRRALQAGARGGRLLGRVVRSVPDPGPRPGEGGQRQERRDRARQGRHRPQSRGRPGVPDREHPGRQGLQGRQGRRRVHRRHPAGPDRGLPRTRSSPRKPTGWRTPTTRSRCARHSSWTPVRRRPRSGLGGSCSVGAISRRPASCFARSPTTSSPTDSPLAQSSRPPRTAQRRTNFRRRSQPGTAVTPSRRSRSCRVSSAPSRTPSARTCCAA